MKTINIFLASSVVEFKSERQELAVSINLLNKICIENDIFLNLERCEDMSDAVELGRKQEQYNERIKNSDYFLMLIGRDVGQYTIEEFDVALEHFQKHGTPKILPYFKKFPDGEQVQESVLKFMERLDKQLGHFYTQYTHPSEIEKKFQLEIMNFVNTWKLQEGQTWPEGGLLDKESKGLQQKKEQKKALDEEYFALMPKLAESPADDDLLKRKAELVQKRGAIQDVIYQMERDSQKKQLEICMDRREEEAIELAKKDDFESAKEILRDPTWEKEVRQAQEKIKRFTGERRKQQLADIRRYIFGKKTLISYIKITGLTWKSKKEIVDIYENITEKAMECQTEQRVLQEYAEFLANQGDLKKGIAVAEKLRQYYENDEETLNRYKAELLLRLSGWYWSVGEPKKDEQCIREALKIISFIPNDLERESLKALADGYMGRCLRNRGQVKEAEKWNREALERSTSLSEENPKDNTLHWILGKNVLAYTYQRLRVAESKEQESEAEDYCWKAIKIFEDLTENYPNYPDASWCSLFPDCEKMACMLQETYRFLAVIKKRRKRRELAENHYRKSLEIGRTIAARNPWANKDIIGSSCRGLAELLEKRDQDEEAEKLYEESWKIYQSLSGKYPKKYRNSAAQILIEYAAFQKERKRKSYKSPFDDFYEEKTNWDLYEKGLSLYHYEEKESNSGNLFDGFDSRYLYIKAKGKLANAVCWSKDAYRFVPKPSDEEWWYEATLEQEDRKENYGFSMPRAVANSSIEIVNLEKMIKEASAKDYGRWHNGTREISWEEWLKMKRFVSKEIEAAFQQALAIFQELDKREVKVPQWDFLLYYEERGTMLWKLMNRVEEADEMYEKACKIAQSYEDKATYKMSVSRIYLKRAMTLATMNRMWESEKFMQKSRKCEVPYKGWEYEES